MLELLLLPFKIVWEVAGAALSIAWGMISLIFGLIGGLIELAVTIAVIALIVGIIRAACRRPGKDSAREERFTSYYDREGTVE